MPPTTQQVLDALEEMAVNAPLAIGWKSIARSAANEIKRLKADRLKLRKKLRANQQLGAEK